MNIFPTERSAFKAAAALDDKRLVRQASEAVIMLGGVLPLLDLPSPYKVTRQPRHKINQWLLESSDNFRWAVEYAYACNVLYRQAYGRTCVCAAPLLEIRKTYIRHIAGSGAFMAPPRPATFCNAASNKARGLDFSAVVDTRDAYRQYLNARWRLDKRLPTWTGRETPKWKEQV